MNLQKYLAILFAFPFFILFNSTATSAYIAVLKSDNLAPYNLALEEFKKTVDPQPIEEHDMKGNLENGRRFIKQIKTNPPDLILVIGVKAAIIAKEEVTDIPIIYCMVVNPDKYKLKGKNIAGISLAIPIQQQFEAVQSIIPTRKNIGVLYDPEKSGNLLDEMRKVASRLGITVIPREVSSPKNVPQILRKLLPDIQALWIIEDSTVLTEESFEFILLTSIEHNLPVIAFSEEFVKHGALVSLSSDYTEIGKQAGRLALKILTGQSPSLFSILQPEKPRLVINLKTAKNLGIEIPPVILEAADRLY